MLDWRRIDDCKWAELEAEARRAAELNVGKLLADVAKVCTIVYDKFTMRSACTFACLLHAKGSRGGRQGCGRGGGGRAIGVAKQVAPQSARDPQFLALSPMPLLFPAGRLEAQADHAQHDGARAVRTALILPYAYGVQHWARGVVERVLCASPCGPSKPRGRGHTGS